MVQSGDIDSKKMEEAINRYIENNDIAENSTSREMAWVNCYKCFSNACISRNINEDYLSLMLTAYLASWGMYTRKSFLLKRDYRIHVPIVQLLVEEEYRCLYGIECKEYYEDSNQFIDKLEKLYKEIETKYDETRKRVYGSENKDGTVSETLITKVLMGTMGCTPAFDYYFNIGKTELGLPRGDFKSKITEIAKKYDDLLGKSRFNTDFNYPQMKLMDMAVWQIGKDKDDKRIEEEKRKKEQEKQQK